MTVSNDFLQTVDYLEGMLKRLCHVCTVVDYSSLHVIIVSYYYCANHGPPLGGGGGRGGRG